MSLVHTNIKLFRVRHFGKRSIYVANMTRCKCSYILYSILCPDITVAIHFLRGGGAEGKELEQYHFYVECMVSKLNWVLITFFTIIGLISPSTDLYDSSNSTYRFLNTPAQPRRDEFAIFWWEKGNQEGL